MADVTPTSFRMKLNESLAVQFKGDVSAAYTSEKEGPAHELVFQATLTLAHKGHQSTASFQGELAPTKKAAEQSAAEQGLRALADSPGKLFGPPSGGDDYDPDELD